MSALRSLSMLAAALVAGGSLIAVQTATAPVQSADARQRMEKVEACLPPPVAVKDDPHPCISLKERMQQLHVPGVSIAVVHNGAIDWADGVGVQKLGGEPVTAETLFQAGSISKPIAAMAALHLVQEGKLKLDSDVNPLLTSWKIPASSAAPGATVTLRESLTHTAGFSVPWISGICRECTCPNSSANIERRKTCEYPAYSSGIGSRQRVEVFRRRLHGDAATRPGRSKRTLRKGGAR